MEAQEEEKVPQTAFSPSDAINRLVQVLEALLSRDNMPGNSYLMQHLSENLTIPFGTLARENSIKNITMDHNLVREAIARIPNLTLRQEAVPYRDYPQEVVHIRLPGKPIYIFSNISNADREEFEKLLGQSSEYKEALEKELNAKHNQYKITFKEPEVGRRFYDWVTKQTFKDNTLRCKYDVEDVYKSLLEAFRTRRVTGYAGQYQMGAGFGGAGQGERGMPGSNAMLGAIQQQFLSTFMGSMGVPNYFVRKAPSDEEPAQGGQNTAGGGGYGRPQTHQQREYQPRYDNHGYGGDYQGRGGYREQRNYYQPQRNQGERYQPAQQQPAEGGEQAPQQQPQQQGYQGKPRQPYNRDQQGPRQAPTQQMSAPQPGEAQAESPQGQRGPQQQWSEGEAYGGGRGYYGGGRGRGGPRGGRGGRGRGRGGRGGGSYSGGQAGPRYIGREQEIPTKHLNVDVHPEDFPALPQGGNAAGNVGKAEICYNRENLTEIYNANKGQLQMAPALSQLGDHLEAVLKRDGYGALVVSSHPSKK